MKARTANSNLLKFEPSKNPKEVEKWKLETQKSKMESPEPEDRFESIWGSLCLFGVVLGVLRGSLGLVSGVAWGVHWFALF